MELQEFVEQTIIQVVRGVEAAQASLVDSKAKVNPLLDGSGSTADFTSNGLARMKQRDGGGLAQIVKFDVALTVVESTGGKAGIGVFSGAFNLGAGAKTDLSNSYVSRVQFTVPLSLPSNE